MSLCDRETEETLNLKCIQHSLQTWDLTCSYLIVKYFQNWNILLLFDEVSTLK